MCPWGLLWFGAWYCCCLSGMLSDRSICEANGTWVQMSTVLKTCLCYVHRLWGHTRAAIGWKQHLLYITLPLLNMQDYTFRLYSDDIPRQFQKGEKVFVWLKSDRCTGLATILQTPDGLPLDGRFTGRYLVQYHVDNSLTAHVRPERLYPVYSEQKLVLVCYSTEDYRRLARSQVRSCSARIAR